MAGTTLYDREDLEGQDPIRGTIFLPRSRGRFLSSQQEDSRFPGSDRLLEALETRSRTGASRPGAEARLPNRSSSARALLSPGLCHNVRVRLLSAEEGET
jgi:hypothetical protein